MGRPAARLFKHSSHCLYSQLCLIDISLSCTNTSIRSLTRATILRKICPFSSINVGSTISKISILYLSGWLLILSIKVFKKDVFPLPRLPDKVMVWWTRRLSVIDFVFDVDSNRVCWLASCMNWSIKSNTCWSSAWWTILFPVKTCSWISCSGLKIICLFVITKMYVLGLNIRINIQFL